jgi:hypothetical protein
VLGRGEHGTNDRGEELEGMTGQENDREKGTRLALSGENLNDKKRDTVIPTLEIRDNKYRVISDRSRRKLLSYFKVMHVL